MNDKNEKPIHEYLTGSVHINEKQKKDLIATVRSMYPGVMKEVDEREKAFRESFRKVFGEDL